MCGSAAALPHQGIMQSIFGDESGGKACQTSACVSRRPHCQMFQRKLPKHHGKRGWECSTIGEDTRGVVACVRGVSMTEVRCFTHASVPYSRPWQSAR